MNKEIQQELYSLVFKCIRKYKKLTQKQLGEILEKKTITIQAYENQRLLLNTEILFTLVKKLHIRRDEMYYSISKIIFDCDKKIMNTNYIEEFYNLLDEIYPFDETEEEKEIAKYIKEKLKLCFNEALELNLHLYIKNMEELEQIFLLKSEKERIIKKTINILNTSFNEYIQKLKP